MPSSPFPGRRLVVFLLAGLAGAAFAQGIPAYSAAEGRTPELGDPSRNAAAPRSGSDEERPNLALRNSLVIGGGATAVMLYGMRQWWYDGFDGHFDSIEEHWFSPRNSLGGADKLGHFYGNYLGLRVLTPLFETVGNPRKSSLSLAFWSTLATYTAVEVADGYSRKYRFSTQDVIANTAGALFGVLMETSPRLDEILDFRFGYRRSNWEDSSDPFGDYSGQRYYLVLKADAFPALRENILTRYLEVSAGYGINIDYGGLHRYRFFGLSLNLSRLLADGVYGGRTRTNSYQNAADRVFELFQFPTAVYRRSEI